MIFGKQWISARMAEIAESLNEKLGEISMQVQKSNTQTDQVSLALDRLTGQEDSLSGQLKKLEDTVSRHDMALMDLLDEWEEQKEERERQRKKEDREQRLLRLYINTLNHILRIRDVSGEGNETIKEQFEMMEKALEKDRTAAGIWLIGNVGEPVDFDRYEVIDVEKTDDQSLHGCVQDVYSYGVLYNGSVVQKARVRAWKYE